MKKRSTNSFLAVLVLMVLLGVFSAEAEETKGPELKTLKPQAVSPWEGANQLYRDKHYSQAAAKYQSLIARYPKSPALYFNLGNAYFKSADHGKAVYCYEMAFSLDPRSRDIRRNLMFVRAQLKVSDGDKVPKYLKGIAGWFSYVRLKETILFLLAVYCFFLVMSLLRYKTHSRMVSLLRGISFIVLLAALLVFGFKFYLSHGQKAIVLEPQALVRYGPSNEEKAAFQLAEGAKVKVVDQSALWYRIQLEGDRTGWVEGKSLGLIREASS